MDELIITIDEIIKYGLNPNLDIANKERLLEKYLVKIYSLYFEILDGSDGIDYPDFDKSLLPNIRQNIESNFKNFGFYKIVIDMNDIYDMAECGLGDAIDDLADITLDLLEVKWRIENNSLSDGLWYFKFIFYAHTQQHILNLLNFIKQIEN
ncbi:MAG: hypothetical protein U5N85_17645 [Arcicella sp.]|nr:hypothetical protein [Arcicella sp.]